MPDLKYPDDYINKTICGEIINKLFDINTFISYITIATSMMGIISYLPIRFT